MKPLKYILFVFLLNILCVYAKAQFPKFEWRLENEKLTSPNTYQFDVYLYNIDTFDFELRAGTIAFFINPLWRNGGTISFSQLSSELALSQQFSGIQYFNQTASSNEYWRNIIGPGSTGQSTQVKSGKRVKLYTYLLTNSVAFSTNQTPNFAWDFKAPAGAGFNCTDPLTGNQVTWLDYYNGSQANNQNIANQAWCYTPSYWNGSQWITKSQKTGKDTTAILDKYHEVTIYNGTFTGKLDIRGYNLFPTCTHNLNLNDSLSVRADFYNLGSLNASNGSIRFNGNDIPGTERSQYTFNPITTKNLIPKNPYHVYLGANATVLSKLYFTKGKVIVGSNNLVLEANAISMGENDSAYVVVDSIGKLIHKNVGSIGKSGTITFPLGTFNDYNPVYMQNLCANNDFSMSIKKEVRDSVGNIVTNSSVNKTWKIKELLSTGSRLNLKFEWKATDELTPFARANSYVACRNSLGKWHTSNSSLSSGLNPFTQELLNFKNLNNYNEFAIGSNGIIKNGNIDTINKVSIINLAIPVTNPQINTNNVVLYRIKVPIGCTASGMSLQSLLFRTTGTYKANDIGNLKIWYHEDSLFSNGSPILLASMTNGLDTGIHIFSGLNQYFDIGNNYIFLTSDLLCSATNKSIGSLCEVILFNSSQQVDKIFTTSTINIQPNTDKIIGPNTTIYNYTNYTYSVPFKANVGYHWSINNGNIISGQGTNQVTMQWLSSGAGNLQVEITASTFCIDTLKTNVTIANNPNCIQLTNIGAPNINPLKGTKNVILTRINISVLCYSNVLNNLKFQTSGSYTNNDIDNFKIWYHTDSIFSNGAPTLLYSKTIGLDTGTYNITGLTKSMSLGNHYLFITTDIACKAQSKRISVLVKELNFNNNPTSTSSFVISSIDINNQTATGNITGPINNVFNNITYTYSVKATANISYTWTIINGSILSGQGTNQVSVEWNVNLQGSIQVIGENQFGCLDTSVQTVSIIYNPACISVTGATAPQSFPNRGSNNVLLYRLDFNVTCNSNILKGIQIRPSGTYSASDISNFRIWYHSNSVFSNGTPTLLSSKTSSLDSVVQIFSSLNQNLAIGKHYIFITTDIPCSTKSKTLTIDAIGNNDIFLSAGMANCSGMSASTISIDHAYSAPIISGVSNNADTLFTYIYSIPSQGNSTYLWKVTLGNIVSGQGTNTINVQWINSGMGKVSVEIENQQSCKDTGTLNVSIVNLFNYIHITNDSANIIRPSSGSKNVLLYKINTFITRSEVYLKSVQLKLQGNFNTSDISNIKLWYHNSPNFNTGNPILLSNKNSNIDTGLYTFLNLNTLFNVGANYLFLTADLPCSANADSISVNAMQLSDIIFTSGIKLGSNFIASHLFINTQRSLDTIQGPFDNLNTSIIYTYKINNPNNANLFWAVANGNILAGQGTNEITVNWLNAGVGKISVWDLNNTSCVDTTILNVSIPSNVRCISISNTSAKQITVGRGSRNFILYRVNIDVACASAVLNSIQFNTSGNYLANNINNFKLWIHSDSNFSVGSPILLSTKTNNLDVSLQKFSSLNQNLSLGKSYLFLTMDLECKINNSFINIDAFSNTDISFQSNVGFGSNYTSSKVNLVSDTMVNDIQGEFTSVIDNISFNYHVDFKPSTSYIWSIENGKIISGQGSNSVDVVWSNQGLGKIKVVAYNQQLCSDSSVKILQVQSFIPLVIVSNSDPQTIIPSKGATNNIIYKINLNVQRLPTTLTGVKFTTIGTYKTEDLNNMKIWYHNNSSFNIGTPQLLGTKSIDIDPGLINYQGLNKSLDTGKHFVFITIDIPCKANNKVISVSPINTNSLSFSTAVVVGNNFTTRPVTINPLPVVANIAGQKANLKTNSIYSYSVTQLANLSYIWTAVNGSIVNGQGTSSVDVKWTNLGNGSINLIGTNPFYCIDTTSIDVNISEISGIENSDLVDKMSVYPNPNNGQFTIKLNSLRKSEISFSLYNLLGQEVWTEKHLISFGSHEFNIDSKLNTGIYLLKIESDSERIIRTLVIK